MMSAAAADGWRWIPLRTFGLWPLPLSLLTVFCHTELDWFGRRLRPWRRFHLIPSAAVVLRSRQLAACWLAQGTPARTLFRRPPRAPRQVSRGTRCCSLPEWSFDSYTLQRTPLGTVVRIHGGSRSHPADTVSSAIHRSQTPSSARASVRSSCAQHRRKTTLQREGIIESCTTKRPARMPLVRTFSL